jgi:hypothetical protein
VLEATKYPEGASQCPVCESMASRTTPPAEFLAALEKESSYVENNLKCVCEIPQARVGAELTACIESTDAIPTVDGQPVNGWCWVDPDLRSSANDELVRACPSTDRRTLRFVGEGNGQERLTFLRCSSGGTR